jgi:molybdopterin/thiamine biosynthesis adenylyltransferase/nitroreductase
VVSIHQRLAATVDAGTVYRPRLFRLQRPDDRDALERLLHDTPQVVVADTIRRQVAELIKTRHPDRRLKASEHERLVTEAFGQHPEVEFGTWVYYPWSQRLVHLLDEADFVELRTNRNTYKITPAERAALARKRLGVVGLSVGQSVALVLALERSFGELRLADFDTLDLSNLNRLRAGVHNIGVPKVLVTAREIAEIDPYLNVVGFFEGVTPENVETFLGQPANLDLLIEECDSIDLKIEIRHAARRRRIPVLMDTSDRGLLDIERFDLEPDRPVFHGLVGDLDPSRLRGLTTEEKIPYVLRIIGAGTISTRLRASLMEIDQTISTWPQLASSVAMGGAVAGDVARRILLGQHTASGRFFVDVDSAVPDSPVEAIDAQPAHQPEAHSIRTPLRSSHAAEGREIPIEQVRRLVTAAAAAPSGGNAQPWHWIWRDRGLHLFLDARHSRSLLDFQSLASVAALGAASENLVLAAHEDGLGVRLTPFPDAAQPSLVAFFTFGERNGSADEPADADPLAAWIDRRATNRRNANRQRIAEDAFTALQAAVAHTAGAGIRWLRTDESLTEAGAVLGAADRLIFLDQRLHHELMAEINFENSVRERGIPVETLELSPSDRAGIEVSRSWPALALVKEWGGGANLEKMGRKALAAASAFGLLTMPATDRLAYFSGGRAFERLWLTATKLGLGLQPMTALSYLFARVHRGGASALEPETLNGLRALWPRWSRLFDVTASDAEVLAFRLVVADPPSARSPRCPIDRILQIDNA